MKKKVWHTDIGDDSLEVLASEIENLENDELSLGEAGFMQGYEEVDEIDDFEEISFEGER